MDYQSSFKIRALVQQLRPHVLESFTKGGKLSFTWQVLQTPDFRSCKGADEIRKKMKLMMDLYKEITLELETHKQGKAVSEYQLPPHKCGATRERKRAKLLQPSCYKSVEKAVESKPSTTTCFSSDKKHTDSVLRGSYIVGGSAFGMNFITFTGGKPSYYGVTKESFRSSHNKF